MLFDYTKPESHDAVLLPLSHQRIVDPNLSEIGKLHWAELQPWIGELRRIFEDLYDLLELLLVLTVF